MKTYLFSRELKFCFLIITTAVLVVHYGCKKESINKTTPLVKTLPVTSTTYFSALINATLVSNGGYSSDPTFNWGICISTNPDPIYGNLAINTYSPIFGSKEGTYDFLTEELIENTLYYVRAAAEYSNSMNSSNSLLVYGSEMTFTTQKINPIITFNNSLLYDTISDIDHTLYKTIKIGEQTWMAENLKVTKYRDGTDIHKSTSGIEGSLFSYNDKDTYSAAFGYLYDFYAVTNIHNLCPTGWHVPTDDEWTTLITNLGGDINAGAKTREDGNVHWLYTSNTESNSSGFTALPGGSRSSGETGNYGGIAQYSMFWSATGDTPASGLNLAFGRSIVFTKNLSFSFLRWQTVTRTGLSVRCIKD